MTSAGIAARSVGPSLMPAAAAAGRSVVMLVCDDADVDAKSKRRVARNEAMLRDANEAIERGLWPGEEHGAVRFRCECSRLECNAAVELDLSDYERVRQQPRRFVMLEGHERPDLEVVIERQPGYVIVEKRGQAGAVAQREDPRD